MRRIQGVLNLVEKYGAVACEDASAAPLELCVPECRFVRRYLERQFERTLIQDRVRAGLRARSKRKKLRRSRGCQT